MSRGRIVIEYRRHSIVSREMGEIWQARALDGLKPATDVFTASDYDTVIGLVKTELDRRAAQEHDNRGPDGFPTAAHVMRALQRVTIADGQATMLSAHLAAVNHTLTATELALSAGKDSYEYANSQYGKLARALAEEMDFLPTERTNDGLLIWTFALATGARDPASKRPDDYIEWQWTLRPSVVDALRSLGF